MRVGVLALQGGFGSHLRALAAIGHRPTEVRAQQQFEEIDGLILPGGESSAQLRLLERHRLEAALDDFVRAGHPVLATCAGLILAAREVTGPAQRSFGWLDVAVARNAYGRQVESFEAEADAGTWGDHLPLVFIRAPRIVSVGPKATVLAALHREAILVRQGPLIGATFHPELTVDARVLRLAFG
jgi:pyridoxal 5'-phosphate synthase pdxT subunit